MQVVGDSVSTSVLHHQREVAKQIMSDWRSSGNADAVAAIRQLGEWGVHKSIALDLAYEEYCLLRESGRSIDPDEFVGRFPGIELSLRRQICIHDALSARGVLGDPEDLPEWPVAGDVIGGFLLNEELGRGAFGRVFLASEIRLRERQVVVKLARQGLHEAQVLAQVPHMGIVPVYSVSADEEWGLTVLCMPFISRATLLDVIEAVHRDGRTPADAWQISAAVRRLNCDDDPLVPRADGGASSARGTYADAVAVFGCLVAGALSAAHEKGIFHRDLKPSNILVDQFGCPLLIDFNLSSEPLAEGAFGGTIPYMSPEQLQAFMDALAGRRSEHEVSGSSDVFSLGVCLFQLLYGVHPFSPIPLDLSSPELAGYMLERQALGPRRVPHGEARVDASLKRILTQCLEFSPHRRPASARELAKEFQKSLSFRNRVSRFARSHPKLYRLSFGVVSASAVLCGVMLSGHENRFDHVRQLAEQAVKHGEYSDAIRHLNLLLEQFPDDGDLLTQRGDAYLKTAQVSLALSDFLKAQSLQPSTQLSARVAWCSTELGDFATAARCYREVLEEFPDSAILQNNLGYVLIREYAFSQAIEHCSRAIQLDPELAIACLNRADALFQHSVHSRKPTPQSALQDLDTYFSRWGHRGGDACLLACRICSTTPVPDKSRFLRYLRECLQHEVPRATLMSDELLKDLLSLPESVEMLNEDPTDGDLTATRRTVPPVFH